MKLAPTPFPHAVVDDYLPSALAQAVAEAFPPPDDRRYTRREHLHSRGKRTLSDRAAMPAAMRAAFAWMEAPTQVTRMATAFSLWPLLADPELIGGGLHLTLPGGKLDIHADFSRHPTLGLRRALNVIVYLTRDWRPTYGGALELWSADMRRCVRTVEPVFNRAVLFATSATSFHGHPSPLRCPPGLARRSLAAYYYTPGAGPIVPTTDYRPRPQDTWLRLRKWLARRLRGAR